MTQIIPDELRFLLKSALNRLNRTLVKTKNKTEVLKLIQKFWPYDTGFNLVRVGSEYDGGYLIPNDLEGIDGLFSPGVAEDASFEKFFADSGINCFLADASVSAAPIEHPKFQFVKKYLGLGNDDQHISLDQWVEDNSISSELILQMDIEGAEYEVLLCTKPETIQRFRIIVVEVHGVDRIITEDGFLLVNSLLSKLERDFVVAHCHPNNNCGFIQWEGITIPRVIEITFHRKDRIRNQEYVTKIPHPLDAPNIKKLPDIILPKEWRTQNF